MLYLQYITNIALLKVARSTNLFVIKALEINLQINKYGNILENTHL